MADSIFKDKTLLITGGTGSFVYYAGGAVTGASRPTPVTAFPSGLSVSNNTITNVAAPVNASDAATKGYVDGGVATLAGEREAVAPVDR